MNRSVALFVALVLLVAHCDACGIEEEFWGELPRVEQHGYARVERIATQHERARHGAAPRQVEGACGVMGHILHRGI